MRWWHWWCRFTPSEAMSPVNRMRTGSSAARTARRSAAVRSMLDLAVQHRDRLTATVLSAMLPACSRAGSTSASQFRVAMRSEKTTTRVGEPGPTPNSFSVRHQRCRSLAASSSVCQLGQRLEPLRTLLGRLVRRARLLRPCDSRGPLAIVGCSALVRGQERLEEAVRRSVGAPTPASCRPRDPARWPAPRTPPVPLDVAGTRPDMDGPRSAQSPAQAVPHLGRFLVRRMNRCVEVSGRIRPGSAIAVSSSRPISSANDWASPLCGVAEARISASVRSASSRASLLFWVPC